MKLTILFLNIFIVFESYGYVHTRSSAGDVLQWDGSFITENIYTDPTNSSGLSSANINSIVDSSIAEWNGNGAITLSRQATTTIAVGRNDLYFTSAPFFASSVLAVTSVSFNSSDGEIVEADIKINDNYVFTTNPNDTRNINGGGPYYLGDIITHEIGHLLGFGHSQTHESTMTFTVFKGQSTISDDEKNAVNALYKLTNKGSISGYVQGGNSLIGVFGAQVTAVSATTGKVIGAAISQANGAFTIPSLNTDDTYYIYTSPTSKSASLPSYYDTVESDFCSAGSNWRGSFFRKCSTSEKGKPQGISLTAASPSVDIGTVSIRCSFDTPSSYATITGTNSINLANNNGSFGTAVTGFFTSGTVTGNDAIISVPASRKADKYLLDLTTYPTLTGFEYLDIKLVAQGLYVPLRASVLITRGDGATSEVPLGGVTTVDTDSDGNYELDIVNRIVLSTTAADNTFTVEIIPQSLTNGLAGVDQSDMLPSPSIFADSLSFYMMIATVSTFDGTNYNLTNVKNDLPLEDNSLCMDGPETYAVQASVTERTSANLKSKEEQAVALLCGAVDMGDGSGSGTGGNAAVILVFSLLMLSVHRKKLSYNS